MIFYDESRTVTYATVQRLEQGGEQRWQISRNRFADGRFQGGPRGRYPELTAAIEVLTAEVRLMARR